MKTWHIVLEDGSEYTVAAAESGLAVREAQGRWLEEWLANDLTGEAQALLKACGGDKQRFVERALDEERGGFGVVLSQVDSIPITKRA